MLADYDTSMQVLKHGTIALPIAVLVAYLVFLFRGRSSKAHVDFRHSPFRFTLPRRDVTEAGDGGDRGGGSGGGGGGAADAQELPDAQPGHQSQVFPVRCIRVRSGNLVDGIEFEYADSSRLSYGGSGGEEAVFALDYDGRGEFLSRIQVRCGDYVDAIRFLTSTGRESPWFGGRGGEVELEFQLGTVGSNNPAQHNSTDAGSVAAEGQQQPELTGNRVSTGTTGAMEDGPRDDSDLEPIYGLAVSTSIRGWLRHVWQVLDQNQVG